MKSRYICILMALVLGALLLAGCSDKTKDNPSRSIYDENGLVFLNPWHFYSIFFSTSENPGYMAARAYLPPGYDWQGGGGRPYPVLYLLSPFRGDERYYFEHGLADVADRLIAEGVIQPMIIVCVDGQSGLGGSFFVDSPHQGNYFTALTADKMFNVFYSDITNNLNIIRTDTLLINNNMVKRFDDWYLTIDDPQNRAVSGVGMGGYGAFKLALETDLFGAVSAINAPLDFDGTGNSGFRTLINAVYPGTWVEYINTGTSVDTIYSIDTSLADPEMSLITAASAAFSPHYIGEITDDDAATSGIVIDSVYIDQLGIQRWDFTPYDSLTTSTNSLLPFHKIHAPIDSATGMINEDIWNVWMQHSIPMIYQNDPGGFAGNFVDMPKLLIKSDQAKYYYNEQMDGFMQFLSDNGIPYESITFAGNQQLTGTVDHFLYDLLEDILIFHSENFDVPDGITGK